jgi:hypothetical protein
MSHRVVSYTKSALRVAAGSALFFGSLTVAGALMVLAEVVDIFEESQGN